MFWVAIGSLVFSVVGVILAISRAKKKIAGLHRQVARAKGETSKWRKRSQEHEQAWGQMTVKYVAMIDGHYEPKPMTPELYRELQDWEDRVENIYWPSVAQRRGAEGDMLRNVVEWNSEALIDPRLRMQLYEEGYFRLQDQEKLETRASRIGRSKELGLT
jgi:hypothetical protein